MRHAGACDLTATATSRYIGHREIGLYLALEGPLRPPALTLNSTTRANRVAGVQLSAALKVAGALMSVKLVRNDARSMECAQNSPMSHHTFAPNLRNQVMIQ